MGLYLLIMVVPLVLGLIAQRLVTRTFARYSEVRSSSGLTGEQTARRILDANGLASVRIEPVAGSLSDHYDPRAKVVRLSQPVFGSSSVSAVSVAAHECGHAIQDSRGYLPMRARAAMFPVVNFSSQAWIFLLMGGALLGLVGLIQLALALYAAAVLFHIVTLPVEIDASRRAGAQLQSLGISAGGSGTRAVLAAAASTYVAAALAAIVTLAYFALIYLGGRR